MSPRIAAIDRELLHLADLALKFGRVDRATYHPDGNTPESDTDHTVMLGLIACSLADRWAQHGLNRGLIAIFSLVHDLPEAHCGDTNTLIITSAQRHDKEARERDAVDRMVDEFGESSWLMSTLAAYERQDTPEARFVKLVDKVLPKYTHALNLGAAFGKLGKSPEEIEAAHRDQIAMLRARYGAEFPEVIEVIDATMDRSVAVYRSALAGQGLL